jgi:hypothetical protein
MYKHTLPDVDIDVADRRLVLKHFKYTPASIIKDGKITKHNTGVYFNKIPIDAMSGCASIDYKDAERLGYFKLDILNVSVYELVKDQEHLDRLLQHEPDWERLCTDKEYVSKLIHLGNYFDVVSSMQPRNLMQLAMILAMIRPAKRHLIGKDWKTVENEIWIKPAADEYYFKKSHSLSYAHLVKIHMNLLSGV